MDMLDPALLSAEAGPSNYATLSTDDGNNPDTSDARRPAFTYASKAIVDESWTQLEAFPGDDDDNASDYETEEEVCYVTLDFGTDIPMDALKQADAFQLTKLNTAEPFARIGTHILRGRHEKLLGSELLFQHEAADAEANRPASIEHIATTQDRISFERLTLAPKPSATVALLNGTRGGRQEQNATSFLLTTGRQNPAARGTGGSRGRGSRGGPRAKATSAGVDEDGEEGASMSTPKPRGRGTGRGSRGGRGARAPAPEIAEDGTVLPVRGRGRGGRPRGTRARGRGRGRGAASAAASSSVGPEEGAPQNGAAEAAGHEQSQLFTGDETQLPAPADRSYSNQSMADLPDVEEF